MSNSFRDVRREETRVAHELIGRLFQNDPKESDSRYGGKRIIGI